MTEIQAPKIEFPCQYPLKVIGDAEPDFADLVVAVIRQYDPGFNHETISLNASRTGKFVSVRLHIEATGKEQLESLHAELMATGRVKLVL
jgi:putative lipoic acid-binding regulatory protein